MPTFTLYDLSTGMICNTVEASEAAAALGLAPPGCGVVEGAFDRATQRIADVVVDEFGEQVPIVEANTLARPPLIKQRDAATRELLDQLQAVDAALIRPQGELLDALLRGLPAPAEAAQRHAQLVAMKAGMRGALAAVAAAATQEALDEALAQPLQTSSP